MDQQIYIYSHLRQCRALLALKLQISRLKRKRLVRHCASLEVQRKALEPQPFLRIPRLEADIKILKTVLHMNQQKRRVLSQSAFLLHKQNQKHQAHALYLQRRLTQFDSRLIHLRDQELAYNQIEQGVEKQQSEFSTVRIQIQALKDSGNILAALVLGLSDKQETVLRVILSRKARRMANNLRMSQLERRVMRLGHEPLS